MVDLFGSVKEETWDQAVAGGNSSSPSQALPIGTGSWTGEPRSIDSRR